jgi:hypothetical protein
MTSPILVAYDPDNHDRSPVTFGALLSSLTGAPLLVASVFNGGPCSTAWRAERCGRSWAPTPSRSSSNCAELVDNRRGAEVLTELVEAPRRPPGSTS